MAMKSEGFVYFVETETPDGVFVKIGFSTNIKKRLSRLEGTQGPIAISVKLIGYIVGTRHTEASLHVRFAADRVRGEWFRDSQELRKFIASLAETMALHTGYNPDVWPTPSVQEIERSRSASMGIRQIRDACTKRLWAETEQVRRQRRADRKAETVRRRDAKLSARQRAHVLVWGISRASDSGN